MQGSKTMRCKYFKVKTIARLANDDGEQQRKAKRKKIEFNNSNNQLLHGFFFAGCCARLYVRAILAELWRATNGAIKNCFSNAHY